MFMKNNITGLIIAYNHSRYIEDSIYSLVDQNLKLEQILILINKSNDSTLKISKRIASKHKKITVINLNKNIGPANSWNLGMSHIETEFALVSSGDDVSEKHRSEMQLSFIQDKDLDIISSNVKLIDEYNSILDRTWLNTTSLLKERKIFENLLWHQNYINGSTIFLKVSRFKKMNPNLLQLHDFDSWLDYSFENKLGIQETELLMYRIHSNSLSQQSNYDSIQKSRIDMELEVIYKKFLYNLNHHELKSLLQPINHLFDFQSVQYNKIVYIIIFLLSHSNLILRNFAKKIILQHSNDELVLKSVARILDMPQISLWKFCDPEC